jgi:hypothetical protein
VSHHERHETTPLSDHLMHVLRLAKYLAWIIFIQTSFRNIAVFASLVSLTLRPSSFFLDWVNTQYVFQPTKWIHDSPKKFLSRVINLRTQHMSKSSRFCVSKRSILNSAIPSKICEKIVIKDSDSTILFIECWLDHKIY